MTITKILAALVLTVAVAGSALAHQTNSPSTTGPSVEAGGKIVDGTDLTMKRRRRL
jgi:hypothetical protein